MVLFSPERTVSKQINIPKRGYTDESLYHGEKEEELVKSH